MRTTSADEQHNKGMAADTFDALMKVVIIGDSSVGKTCLVLRYTQDIFRENFLSTIGTFATKSGRIREGKFSRDAVCCMALMGNYRGCVSSLSLSRLCMHCTVLLHFVGVHKCQIVEACNANYVSVLYYSYRAFCCALHCSLYKARVWTSFVVISLC